jgi:hypothetical protein
MLSERQSRNPIIRKNRERGVGSEIETRASSFSIKDLELLSQMTSKRYYEDESGMTPEEIKKNRALKTLILAREGQRIYFVTKQENHKIIPDQYGDNAFDVTPLYLDSQNIRYIIEHIETFEQRFPELATIAIGLSDLRYANPIHTLTENISANGTSDDTEIRYIQQFNPGTWDSEEVTQEICIAIRSVPEFFHSLHNLIPGTVTYDDLDADCPRESLALMRQSLTLTERLVLQLKIQGISSNLPLSNHTDIIQKISATANSRLNTDEPWINGDESWLQLIDAHDLERTLENKGKTDPLIVLDQWKKYRSCPATEARLLNEIEAEQAAIVRFKFPDDTDATIIIKYTEITIGVCIQSTNPLFRAKDSYIPIGNTFSWAGTLTPGKVHVVHFNKTKNTSHPPKYSIQQIWAFNRPIVLTKKQWTWINDQLNTLSEKESINVLPVLL